MGGDDKISRASAMRRKNALATGLRTNPLKKTCPMIATRHDVRKGSLWPTSNGRASIDTTVQ
eukprot:CAMPEP_0170215142 /NCGR_PEP_ID=MMETSP0116_2-20130129/7205_1 /TAXON_ID=400756 /ORGANISM="Durinskia baltica, Strain CSIRO CS-38" /LENGTH=61 /DNA_ID=CAMNT_0010465713 /DNA_START=80 /DNA_END=265 /DNA_ORIENTATION=+